MRKPKGPKEVMPWTTKKTPGGTILWCLTHQVAIYAGTCSLCFPKALKYGLLEGSRGVDAGPEFVKRYTTSYDGTESSVRTDPDLCPLEDPYGSGSPPTATPDSCPSATVSTSSTLSGNDSNPIRK